MPDLWFPSKQDDLHTVGCPQPILCTEALTFFLDSFCCQRSAEHPLSISDSWEMQVLE